MFKVFILIIDCQFLRGVDVDAFIAFFVVNIGSVVWCFSIRRLGAVCICS